MDGVADRVGGLAEVEIERARRVGEHGDLPAGNRRGAAAPLSGVIARARRASQLAGAGSWFCADAQALARMGPAMRSSGFSAKQPAAILRAMAVPERDVVRDDLLVLRDR
jgi:hypothetical protein